MQELSELYFSPPEDFASVGLLFASGALNILPRNPVPL